jgi:hypothetical protein
MHADDMGADQARFRQKLQDSGATVAFFSDAGDLKFKVSRAVGQSVQKRTEHQDQPPHTPRPDPPPLGRFVALAVFLLIAGAIAITVASAATGGFPPWGTASECDAIEASVRSAEPASFGSQRGGARLEVVVSNLTDDAITVPASRNIQARGESGQQYQQDDRFSSEASWFFDVEIQPRSSAVLILGLSGTGSDRVTIVIPNVNVTLLAKCNITSAPVDVDFS